MRVVIAGAGSVGRSIARELLENGHEVLLIDKDPHAIRVAAVPRRRVAARRRVRDLLARGGRLADCDVVVAATGDDKVEPRRLAAGQDRVRRPPHRRPREQPEERVDVRRGVGRGRRRVDAAHDDGAGRGGRHRRRPGADLHVPPGPRDHGRADAAGGLARAPASRVGDIEWPPDTVLVGILREEPADRAEPDDTLEAQRRAAVRDGARERGRAELEQLLTRGRPRQLSSPARALERRPALFQRRLAVYAGRDPSDEKPGQGDGDAEQRQPQDHVDEPKRRQRPPARTGAPGVRARTATRRPHPGPLLVHAHPGRHLPPGRSPSPSLKPSGQPDERIADQLRKMRR